eukprot:scaffold41120_cov1416-Skeletonema_dohrnii-CCMP3373.AAC.1
MICRAQPRQVGDNDGGGEKASEPLGEGAGRFDVIVNVDNDNDGGGGGRYYAFKQQSIDRSCSQLSKTPLIAFLRPLQAKIWRNGCIWKE